MKDTTLRQQCKDRHAKQRQQLEPFSLVNLWFPHEPTCRKYYLIDTMMQGDCAFHALAIFYNKIIRKDDYEATFTQFKLLLDALAAHACMRDCRYRDHFRSLFADDRFESYFDHDSESAATTREYLEKELDDEPNAIAHGSAGNGATPDHNTFKFEAVRSGFDISVVSCAPILNNNFRASIRANCPAPLPSKGRIELYNEFSHGDDGIVKDASSSPDMHGHYKLLIPYVEGQSAPPGFEIKSDSSPMSRRQLSDKTRAVRQGLKRQIVEFKRTSESAGKERPKAGDDDSTDARSRTSAAASKKKKDEDASDSDDSDYEDDEDGDDSDVDTSQQVSASSRVRASDKTAATPPLSPVSAFVSKEKANSQATQLAKVSGEIDKTNYSGEEKKRRHKKATRYLNQDRLAVSMGQLLGCCGHGRHHGGMSPTCFEKENVFANWVRLFDDYYNNRRVHDAHFDEKKEEAQQKGTQGGNVVVRCYTYRSTGIKVCQKCFHALYNVGEKKLRRGYKRLKTGSGAQAEKLKVKELASVLPVRASPQFKYVYNALVEIIGLDGETMPNSNKIAMIHTSKEDLYSDVRSAVYQANRNMSCHDTTIARVLANQFPTVFIPKANLFLKCTWCGLYKAAIANDKLSAAKRQEAHEGLAGHRFEQGAQRKLYWRMQRFATLNPHDTWTVMIDGMDVCKTHLPTENQVPHHERCQRRRSSSSCYPCE